ncbi:Uncharacterised protein [Bordetella pertussis]|nr:Uncharacterised protein [Bordetella pertussis]
MQYILGRNFGLGFGKRRCQQRPAGGQAIRWAGRAAHFFLSVWLIYSH